MALSDGVDTGAERVWIEKEGGGIIARVNPNDNESDTVRISAAPLEVKESQQSLTESDV
jgi:hypothetical protein